MAREKRPPKLPVIGLQITTQFHYLTDTVHKHAQVSRDDVSCHHSIQANYTPASYPVYHSVHDNFYWMQHFGDPDFSRHLALGLVWAKTGILLATTPVLPYDPRDYAIALNRIYNGLVQQYTMVLQQQNITLGEGVASL